MYGSLWIAFRIVFLLMIPNAEPFSSLTDSVVNCFQNCIFTYDSQRNWFMGLYCNCCELLSELYFYLWFPTIFFQLNTSKVLWIAFRIVFLLMIPNIMIFSASALPVVNCFQNCIFTYDSQQESDPFFYGVSCELLSELYFYLWFPTSFVECMLPPQLWIAFRIVFLLMIPNSKRERG